MKEQRGDLWHLVEAPCLPPEHTALVITTNGFVKRNGDAVMGRGIALQAAQRIPGLPRTLGDHIRAHGNIVHVLRHAGSDGYAIASMPVKHNWWEDADPALIVRSAVDLAKIADVQDWTTVLMPRPGCGNGHLSWTSIKPLIQPILDDRFIAVTYR